MMFSKETVETAEDAFSEAQTAARSMTCAMREAYQDGFRAGFRLGEERITELQTRMSEMVNSSLARRVRAFMAATGQEVQTTPTIADDATARLRMRLVEEEHDELRRAIAEDDLVEIADAIADLYYVLEGTAAAYGIHMQPIVDEVHRNNMGKAGCPKDEHGKIKKPDNWVGPDIRGKLIEQGWKP